MREIKSEIVTETVAELCVSANKQLPSCINNAIDNALINESCPLAREILSDIKQNSQMAKKLNIPICQDTGMAVVFAEVGQDVHIIGSFEEAVNLGVKKGYEEGLLRKSVVADPLNRINTNDNTPAVIHTRLVSGDKIKITVAPKGFGSENMSKMKMLTPADGREGVIDSVLEIVKAASSNPCPPMVIGVGIGSDFEGCALLAKKALCRSLDEPNDNPFYAKMEEELLERVNSLGIGPQGFGGITTALAVNVEAAPTHIAGLPVAVNIGCYVTRHKTVII